MLEEKIGKPVLGVLPYLPGLALEAEDSVALETYYKQQPAFSPSRVDIAVVTLRHIANFTDFLPLSNIDSVALNYVHTPNEIVNADVVILPGSKNTIADLRWLKAGHWACPLRQLEEHDELLVGVCAGYKILGQENVDSLGVEGICTSEEELGFLPLHTELVQEKPPRRVEGQWQIGPNTGIFSAYEIHMGRTMVGSVESARSGAPICMGCLKAVLFLKPGSRRLVRSEPYIPRAGGRSGSKNEASILTVWPMSWSRLWTFV